jgi:hypothetical protein
MLHYIQDISNIEKAEKLLKEFSISYIKLYGEGNLTYTFHCLTKHLIDDVTKHGSLAMHSMFSFEGELGHSKESLNGTRGLANQYIKSKLAIKFI